MTRHPLLRLLALALLVAFVGGCATIVSKSKYPVKIRSNPEGAQITVTNAHGFPVYRGKTPATVPLDAGDGYFIGADYLVEFKLDGYEPFVTKIKRGIDAWYAAGNLISFGMLGWLIVDPSTGAMWTLKDVYVNLLPKDTAQQSPRDLQVVTLDEVPEHLRPHLVPLQ